MAIEGYDGDDGDGREPEDDLPLRPGDNPYPHWAECMARAPARDADRTVEGQIEQKEPDPRAEPDAPFDGRRLRLPLREDEIAAVPLVIRLGGEPRSAEREEARAALAAQVDEGVLRMEPHERMLLAERREDGNGHGAEGLRPFAELPEELLRDEVYCVYRPAGGEDLRPDQVIVEQGVRMAVPREPSDPLSAPDPEPICEGDCEGDPPVIGVIDDGLAFLNARFRRPGARATRFDAVWLQAFGAPRDARGAKLSGKILQGRGIRVLLAHAARRATLSGTILQAPDIDAVLAQGEALDEAVEYRALSRALYQPGAHRALERGFSHGTHVADLAAGADPGGADEARCWPMLGVQLPPEAVDDTAGRYLQPLAIAAVRWMLCRARRLGRGPVVINISMGSLAGPKDCTRAIEWVVALEVALFEARTGRLARINWSFGNARRGRQVAVFAEGEVPSPIEWRLQPDDRAASFLEIRPEGGRVDELTVNLTMPDGRTLSLPAPDPFRPRSVLVDGRLALRLYRMPVPPPVGAWRDRLETPALVLAASPTWADDGLPGAPRAPAGAHEVHVRWSGRPGLLRLEVERGDTAAGHQAAGRQSYLDHPLAYARERETAAYTDPTASAITRAGTHTANASPCEERVWTTGAARPGRAPDAPRPAPYAGAGRLGSPTTGPTLTALAERGVALRGLVAAGTLSGSARASAGSSAAAPCASRVAALALTGRRAPGRPQAQEVAAILSGWGAPADAGREGLAPTHPDHLEPADPPEPGDAARLGAGTITAPFGRGPA